MPSSSPADTDAIAPAAAPLRRPRRHRWWLAVIVAVAFAVLVVAVIVLSVWFEMIMFPLPTATIVAAGSTPPLI